MKRKKKPISKISFPLSSMIDCTFLLLIYFMSACSLNKSEADLGFSLPGQGREEAEVKLMDEEIIALDEKGIPFVNDEPYRELEKLIETLKRFKEAAHASKSQTLLTIAADDAAPHQSLAEVLACCRAANLTNVTFATEDDEF